MNKSWGLLGELSKNQIEFYSNMPYGTFKKQIAELNKRYKGKTPNKYYLKIVEIEKKTREAFLPVISSYSEQNAIKIAMTMDAPLDWGPEISHKNTREYKVVQIS